MIIELFNHLKGYSSYPFFDCHQNRKFGCFLENGEEWEGNIKQLGRSFLVDPQAMAYRVNNLGIADNLKL